MISQQDWTPIIWEKKNIKNEPPKKPIICNKQKNANTITNTIKKIYDENNPTADPDIQPILVDKNLATEIQKRRLEKKMSQQQLANALSIPVSIINEYERGIGIRNGTYIAKIKKILNI